MSDLSLATAHGDLPLPAFLPDATRGLVRTLDADDVAAAGIQALMVNVLHLSSHPGASIVESLGGIHRFMGWQRPVASDSGGFQVLSLIDESGLGSVSRRGFTYRLAKGQKRRTLTPAKCIQRQFQLGSDLMFCLDHCTRPEAPADLQRESVDNTVAWARGCRDEFDRRCEALPDGRRKPLLFGVVQGGSDPDLRRRCAEGLREIGFDGYGFGGWPVDGEGALVDAVPLVAELAPAGAPLHALGVGKPENVARAFGMGYTLFDCTLPTRDARHTRLYAFSADAGVEYHHVYIADEEHARADEPVSAHCDCHCCRRWSRAYLHHLFAIRDPLAFRLATIHNLRFYARLMERLRSGETAP